ncbi:terminase small subunit [Paraburkholderia sp. BR10936]|uniref:terminase small subunit n=1 Tax=Paraburkholderia sp. BR10936 TaxID=3236993 RepID=UPI0034D308F1
MSDTYNRSGLAAAMGVALPTIDAWRKDGMPVVKVGGRGVEWEFSLKAVIAWRIKTQVDALSTGQSTDMEEIERRTALAKMEKAELELSIAKGEVAPIKDFERVQTAVMATIQQNIMNVPQRVVLQLLGETSEAEFKKKLSAELRTALEQAASGDIDIPEEDETGDEESV